MPSLRLSEIRRILKQESLPTHLNTMAPVPPNYQEIPGVILTLPDGRWVTATGQITDQWPERGVWADEATARAFLDLLFSKEP